LSQLLTVVSKNSSDSTGMFTQKLSDRLSVRLYGDCRPKCLETGALQKGLVLLLDGKELIEEGVGFGVPIVKYEDKTFFPGAADIYLQERGLERILTKVYYLNMVSLKKFGFATYIGDSFYSPLRKAFQILYLKYKKLTPLFNKLMELRDLANIRTEFMKVKPRAKIPVSYLCRKNRIEIHADFSEIALSRCSEILVLNEQGAGFFQKYVDSHGLNLMEQKIGAWEMVSAKQATLQNATGTLSFRLQNRGGSKLFRGLEHTKRRFSWAGLSYSIHPHNGTFDYSVTLTSS
jgi:hypothetical protein